MKKDKNEPQILIVDDEPSNILLLKRVLGRLDCQVVAVNNGWQAIEEAKKSTFALILLDILMPEINGYETLVRIKGSTKNKDTPVFFMTGMETDQELLVNAYKAGAVDFIQKPINLNILQRKTKYFLNYFLQNEQLRFARQESERLMKSRMSLIANITHELRTPLFAMLGMIDVLKKENTDTHLNEIIQKIGMNSENLLDTVNEFLDFSKAELGEGQTIQNEYFSLKKMCQDIINLMNYQYHKKDSVALELSFSQDISEFVRADKKKIRHILLNLFSNALKFTSSGYVKLSVRNIGLKQGKPFLKFSVEDTGIGIPADKIGTIFNEFTQVDNEYQENVTGTGLGLSISNKLVALLGGKLQVKSKEGKGTQLSFAIPVEPGTESDIEEIKESYSLEELLGDHQVSILIADDVPDNLFVLKNYLNTTKVNLKLVSDAQEALEEMKKESYDIAMLDINMPKMTGFEVAKRYTKYAKEKGEKLSSLVALTAFDINEGFLQQMKEAGIGNYIMKPVRKELLYKEIVSIVHNLSDDSFTKIAALKEADVIDKDYDFDLLDQDFKDYLPTYIDNKLNEVRELKSWVVKRNVIKASGMCHKVLGTAKSFGLFKIDRELELAQKLIKQDLEANYQDINDLVESSLDHLEKLKTAIS